MKLRGAIPVMAASYHDDEVLDEEGLRRQVDFSIERGAAAICAPGFGTEFYKLSDPERYRVAEVVLEHTAKRKPVIISTGSGSIFTTIQFSRFAESKGANCLMVLPPRITPLTVKELIRFYERVAGSVTIPIMIQDADFTGTGISPKVYADLSLLLPNLKFAKLENHLPGTKCEEIIRESDGRLQVIFGFWGIYMADGLPKGATAIMAGPGIVEVYARIISLFDEGKIGESRKLLYRIMPYLTFCLQHLESGLALDKRMLMRRGILRNEIMREPHLHLAETNAREMDELVELGLGLCNEIVTTQSR
jgi:dihydrodipicolinate synthase/N-acetylneuraminate lyase